MITVGIITDGKNNDRVSRICNSIYDYRVQIIIIGGLECNIQDINSSITTSSGSVRRCRVINFIPFDETERPGWISRKKNLVAQIAIYNNICFVHDYVEFEDGWLDGFLKFEHDHDPLTCTNRVKNLDGSRYRDLAVIGNDSWHDFNDGRRPFFSDPGRLLDYGVKITDDIARWFYYSGAFFCAKKRVLLDVPIPEERLHGQGEDVLWCRQLYFKYGAKAFSFNPHSSVRFLKQKESVQWQNLPPIN